METESTSIFFIEKEYSYLSYYCIYRTWIIQYELQHFYDLNLFLLKMMHQILGPEVAVFKSICFSTNKLLTKKYENSDVYKERLINGSPIAKKISYTRKDLVDAYEKILQAYSSCTFVTFPISIVTSSAEMEKCKYSQAA